MKEEKAIFGGGCFWGVESIFHKTPGVLSATSGYGGGHVDNPTYKQVCTAQTGHAEVVLVTFDPAIISYAQLVDLFFRLHDPTQYNRQGPDYGPQYRSVIYCFDEAQLATARAVRDQVQPHFNKKIVTEIDLFTNFFAAEDYHQGYADRHGVHCHVPRASW